jgi:chorismate lyase / 3-hydroxybenzoate synthase
MGGLDDTAELLVRVRSRPSSLDTRPNVTEARHLLGNVSFGRSREPAASRSALQHVDAEWLDPASAFVEEQWLSRQHFEEVNEAGLRARHTEHVMFGCIEVEEEPGEAGAAFPLERAAQVAYRRLFQTLNSRRFPFLWRTWNYMARINQQTHGIERYRQFNSGRQQGFALDARAVTGHVPAACAIGVRAGPLSVAFLAGRHPAIAIENPRQVSACRYPAQYGRQPPTFARASLARLPGQEWLLLSGTASIVGHETRHAGDVGRQVAETLVNIEAVIAEANLQGGGDRDFHLHDFQFRVYVRHASDVEAIRTALAPHLAPRQSVLFLHADICRSDLDVEIEGSASRRAKKEPA